ncbi:hypothetical protein [Brevundimonas sp.]
MISTIAQTVVLFAGLWLAGLGVWMFVRPVLALDVLKAMGSSPLIHFGEMALRTAAGFAFVVAAPQSRFPLTITVIGVFLIVTAVALTALPRRWHVAYSTAWAQRIPVIAVRMIAPVSIVAGGVLIWTMI